MTYRVIFAPSCLHNIDARLAYWREQQVADNAVQRWFDHLWSALERLETLPYAFPIDRFATRASALPIRKVTLGDDLVFYQIREAQREVWIVALVHGATRAEASDDR
ncbi:MAG: hypothetical protein AAF432_14495 [Planctomycetota bacterium]